MCVSDIESLRKPNSELKLILGITLLLFAIIGCIGNSVAIGIVAKVLRSRQTLPNVLILVLASVDLLTIFFGFVPALLNYCCGLSIVHTPALCNVQGTILNILYLKSVILVCSLSFDRFLALYTPFFYKRHAVLNCKKFTVTVVIFSFIAMAICLLPAFGLGQHVLQYPGTFCLFQFNPKDLGAKIILNTNLTLLLLCMVFVVVCNSAVSWKSFTMFKRSRHQRPSAEGTESNLSVCSTDECQFAILSFIVMTSFVCSWTMFMIRLIMLQTGSPFNNCWDVIAVRLVTFHTICNPWIYLLTRKQYRKGFVYIVRLSAHYITCKKLSSPKESFDKILGLPAARKVVQFHGRNKTDNDNKETLLRSAKGNLKEDGPHKVEG